MIANVSIACTLAQASSRGDSGFDIENILYILFIVGFGLLSWVGKWIKRRQQRGAEDKKEQAKPEPLRIDLREIVQSLAQPPVAKPARPAAASLFPSSVASARGRPPKPPPARPQRDRRPAVPSLAAMRPARRGDPAKKPTPPVQRPLPQVEDPYWHVPPAKDGASVSMTRWAEEVTPSALRKAIVLAEILGPPVAMRAIPDYAREA